MTADKPKPVLPNLRFPEFRCAGDWQFQPLGDIAEPISDVVGTTKCVPMSVMTGIGLVSQEEKFGRTIAGNSYKNYVRLQTNDFAYNKSATKDFPQGYIARYSGTKDAAVPNSISHASGWIPMPSSRSTSTISFTGITTGDGYEGTSRSVHVPTAR